MSDDIVKEEFSGLISQEMLDELLAEVEVSGGEREAVDDGLAGDGFISQSDIDQLLNGASTGESGLGPEVSGGERKAVDDEPEPAEAEPTDAGDPEDDLDLISQEDIEQLLKGVAESEESEWDEDIGLEVADADQDDSGLITQGDIERLLETAGDSPETEKNYEVEALSSPDSSETAPTLDAVGTGIETVGTSEPAAPVPGVTEPSRVEAEPSVVSAADESGMLEQPVILEPETADAEALPYTENTAVDQRPLSGRYGNVFRIAVCAAGVCIATTLAGILMSYIKTDPSTQSSQPTAVYKVPEAQAPGAESSLHPEATAAPLLRLDRFVILGPASATDVTGIRVDMIVEVREAAVLKTLARQKQLIRHYIYTMLNDVLRSPDGSALNKARLEAVVQQELDRFFPHVGATHVVFDTFDII